MTTKGPERDAMENGNDNDQAIAADANDLDRASDCSGCQRPGQSERRRGMTTRLRKRALQRNGTGHDRASDVGVVHR